ncbi:hypothetical protein [Aureivirga sp. CE67]|uniref:hypothetical protein n=1 Tax=Aureivirga sp. CE67 TaxID=1788983 RepID=UPI0018CBCA01|nr:hypothetical protein [Aureivirga sp. CE67]
MFKKIFFAVLILTFISCKNDDNGDYITPEKKITGFLYTSTNPVGENAVLGFKQFDDGTVEELENSPFFTKDIGANIEGDFDAQFSIRIVDDFLLVVNAGKNPENGSISVFKIDKPTGNLTLIDQTPENESTFNIDSQGIRPVTLAITEQNGKTWVVVGNQHSTYGFAGESETPSGEFINSDKRSVVLFSLNKNTGILTFETIIDSYFDANIGGISSVDFNQNGDRLSVSTLGIYHFSVPFPNPDIIKPSYVNFYDFNNGNSTLAHSFFQDGISGTTAAVWSPNGTRSYAASFNLIEEKIDHDVYSLNTSTYEISENFRAGTGFEPGTCWSNISLDKKTFFAVNFGENAIISYNIGEDDAISEIENGRVEAKGLEPDEFKDLINLGNYVYVISAINEHKISIFYLSANGVLTELADSPYEIPSSIGKTSADEIYLGLAGYELE